MSAIEETCRRLIVQAYCIWCFRQHRTAGMVSYARALGVEPTTPLSPMTRQELDWRLEVWICP